MLLDALQAPRGLVSGMENFSSRSLARTFLLHAPRLTILTSHIHTHTHARARARAHTTAAIPVRSVSYPGVRANKKPFFQTRQAARISPLLFGYSPFFLSLFCCRSCVRTRKAARSLLYWTLKACIGPSRLVLDLKGVYWILFTFKSQD